MNNESHSATVASSLDFLFNPRSVAIVGSPSEPAANQGAGVFLDALIHSNYQGNIYPVNPKVSEIRGLKAYPDFLSVPQVPDLVICCLPAPLVPSLVDDCARRGAKAISIYTAGFGETGTEGGRVEREMAHVARRSGMRLIGPNCMGLYCPGTRLSYSPLLSLESGTVGLFCQSGGNSLALVIMANYLGIHFSKVVSYGNAADLAEADFLEYLTRDAETRVICAYIEGAKDGRRFFRGLKEAAKSKPVAILKGGSTGAGAKAASSHTGALVSDERNWSALCRQAGVTQVHSLEEMVDFMEACLHAKPPKGRRMGIIAWGGGPSVLSADDAEASGLSVPGFSKQLRQKLSQFISEAGSSLGNPVDSAMLANPTVLSEAIGILVDSGEVDLLLIRLPFAVGGPPFDAAVMTATAEAVVRMSRLTDLTLALVMPHGDTPGSSGQFMALRRICLDANLPLYSTTSRAACALARFADSVSHLEP